MFNLVEICSDEQHDSPCKFGNIVDYHACYCHAPYMNAPRKCNVWRNHGESDLPKWNDDECEYFEKMVK